MRQRLIAAFLLLTALSGGLAPARAALDPVFFFDASTYESTSVDIDSIIEDSSTANNDAKVRFDLVTISTDVPTGMTGKSFDLTGIGMFETTATRLLLNENVVAAGGFVMEAWVKGFPTNGNTGKVIDYGGYERLQWAGSNSGGGAINNRNHMEFRMSNTTHRVGGRLPVEMDDQWHYAIAEFVVTDGSNLANVLGNMRVTIDGQADVKVDGGKTNAGDTAIDANTQDFASHLAIGTRSTVNPGNPGGSGDNLEALVYQPKVWLGTVADPVRLRVNTTTGAVSFGYVQNATIPGATRFGTRISSYEISSTAGSLRPQNLNSFQDQNLDPNNGTGEDGRFDEDNDADGNDFLLWQQQLTEAGAEPHTGPNGTADARINGIDLALWTSHFGSPTTWQELTASANSISELHGTHGTVVSASASPALGTVFDPALAQDLVFTYKIDGDPILHTGIVEYVTGSAAVPEPATASLLAAALAAVGGGLRRRSACRA